jgi:hypothetical protein
MWIALGPQGDSACHLAVQGGQVYFADAAKSTVLHVPKGGGTPSPIPGPALFTVPGDAPCEWRAFAVDATHVYFADGRGTLQSEPLGGGSAVTVVSAPGLVDDEWVSDTAFLNAVDDLAVDDHEVYVHIFGDDDQVSQAPLTGAGAGAGSGGGGTPPAGLTPVLSTHVFALGPHGVYGLDGVSDDGHTWLVRGAPGNPFPPARVSALADPEARDSDEVRGFTVHADFAYVSTRANEIYRYPLDGRPPVLLAHGLPGPDALATDGTTLYFSNRYDGTIRAVSTAGGAVTLVAHEQTMPVELAVDDTTLYWLHGDPDDGFGASVPYLGILPKHDVAAAPAATTDVGDRQETTRLAAWGDEVAYEHLEDVALATADTGPFLITKSGNWLGSLAYDGTSVYFQSGDDLLQAPPSGSPPVPLASAAISFALVGGVLYESRADGVYALPVASPGAGAAPSRVARLATLPGDQDESHLTGAAGGYVFAAYGDGTLLSAPKGGTLAPAHCPGLGEVLDLASDTDAVYVTDSRESGAIFRLSGTDGACTRLVTGLCPWAVAARHGRVYFANTCDGTIRRIDGSATTVIASEQDIGGRVDDSAFWPSLAVTDHAVYFGTQSGVRSVPP